MRYIYKSWTAVPLLWTVRLFKLNTDAVHDIFYPMSLSEKRGSKNEIGNKEKGTNTGVYIAQKGLEN